MRLYHVLLIVLLFEIILFVGLLCASFFYFKLTMYDSINILSNIFTIQGFFFANTH
jgi:hypothetical protein